MSEHHTLPASIHSLSIDNLADRIFDSLRNMDNEASTQAPDKGEMFHTGLYWYQGHWNKNPKNIQTKGTELAWTRRMSQLLSCKHQQKYPNNKRQTCDLAIQLSNGQEVWIEVKPSFRLYWHRRNQLYRYEHRLFALDEPKLQKEASVARDIRKLEDIPVSAAAYVGMLLIGFDSLSDSMDNDVQRLRALTGIGASPWRESSTRWPDPYREDQRIQSWFWCRPVAPSENAMKTLNTNIVMP